MKRILLGLFLISFLWTTPAFTAELKITVPDDIAQRVLDGCAYRWGYQDEINDLPNPETKKQFILKQLRYAIKNAVKEYEAGQAIEAAKINAEQKAEQEIDIQ